MKEINVNSHSVPATARSKNYRTAQSTTASSGGGGGATSPSVAPTTGGATDTAKVAQNLAADSTDWAKILRKDIDERTENSLSIGKDITVDGRFAISGALAINNQSNYVQIDSVASHLCIEPSAYNVGIGITTPNEKLTVLGTINNPFDNSGIICGNDLNLGFVKKVGYSAQVVTDSNNDIVFSKLSTTTLSSANIVSGILTELFRITNIGNVGIGTTTPTYKLDVNGTARIASDLYADATVGTRNFASRVSGWQVNAQGAADFRNIYADELRVQAFTADISQALAGSDYLTKSVSKLSANFVVPAVNSTVRIIVDDIEGMPATQCFANNDYIRFRAFNRTSGLTIANVWGTVVLDTTFGTNGFSNGTQAYTFTCKATSGAGLTVFKGSEVLDYGTSGSGMISRTTLDAQGSPYEQIATWVNDPSVGSNYTVHARLGNLNGIANCNGYGLYTDNGFFTGKITVGDLTKNNNYLDFSGGALTVKGNVYLASGDSAVGSNGVISAINLTSEDATIQASKINLVGAVTIGALDSSVTAAALGGATPKDVSTAVNNIQIGGRNLIIYSKLINGWIDYGKYHDESTKMCDINYYKCNGNQNFVVSVKSNPNPKGTDSHIAFYDSDRNFIQDITIFYNGNVSTPSFISPSNAAYYRYGICYRENICKIEIGNKATDWTPAPEDVNASVASAQAKANTAYDNAASAQTDATAAYDNAASAQTDATAALTRNNTMAVKLGYTDYNALASSAALGKTLINGGMINTLLINATAVVTNGLTANSITGDKIAGNTITGDKIVTNSITGDKLVMKTITALGNVTAGSFNIGSGKFVVDANGNMTAVNATISGTLDGVSGTFNYLQGVGSNGKLWFDNTFEALSIKDEDFRHLGRKNTRMVRLYASNIRCLGSFGASSLNMARVHDTYIDYYVNGDTYSYVRANLKSNGVGGYYIQLYPTIDKEYSLFVGGTSLGDVTYFPVDLLIFDNSANYHYEMLAGACGKKVIAVNANNNINVLLAINGNLTWLLQGGKVQTLINIRELTNPTVSSSVHGAGWLSCSEYDNEWN